MHTYTHVRHLAHTHTHTHIQHARTHIQHIYTHIKHTHTHIQLYMDYQICLNTHRLTHPSTHILKLTWTPTHTHVFIYTFTHKRLWEHIQTQALEHTCMHTHKHTHTLTRLYKHSHTLTKFTHTRFTHRVHQTRTHIHTIAHIHTSAYTYTYTLTHAHAGLSLSHMKTVQICMYECSCVVYIQNPNNHLHVHVSMVPASARTSWACVWNKKCCKPLRARPTPHMPCPYHLLHPGSNGIHVLICGLCSKRHGLRCAVVPWAKCGRIDPWLGLIRSLRQFAKFRYSLCEFHRWRASAQAHKSPGSFRLSFQRNIFFGSDTWSTHLRVLHSPAVSIQTSLYLSCWLLACCTCWRYSCCRINKLLGASYAYCTLHCTPTPCLIRQHQERRSPQFEACEFFGTCMIEIQKACQMNGDAGTVFLHVTHAGPGSTVVGTWTTNRSLRWCTRAKAWRLTKNRLSLRLQIKPDQCPSKQAESHDSQAESQGRLHLWDVACWWDSDYGRAYFQSQRFTLLHFAFRPLRGVE